MSGASVVSEAAIIRVQTSGSVTNSFPVGNQFIVSLSDSSTFLSSGALIQVGYFTNTIPVGIFATRAALDALQASFVQFGTNTVSITSRPGTITNAVFNASFGPFRPTNQLAVWIWNSNTTSSSTQVGIFTATNWVFPPIDGASASLVFFTNYVSAGSMKAILGSFDTPGTYTFPNARSMNLVPIIPEPGSAAVAVAAALAGMASRRRSARERTSRA